MRYLELAEAFRFSPFGACFISNGNLHLYLVGHLRMRHGNEICDKIQGENAYFTKFDIV